VKGTNKSRQKSSDEKGITKRITSARDSLKENRTPEASQDRNITPRSRGSLPLGKMRRMKLKGETKKESLISSKKDHARADNQKNAAQEHIVMQIKSKKGGGPAETLPTAGRKKVSPGVGPQITTAAREKIVRILEEQRE